MRDLDGDEVPDVTYIDSDRDGQLDTVLIRATLIAAPAPKACHCRPPSSTFG